MSFDSATFFTASDPSRIGDDLETGIRPALSELGSTDVAIGEPLANQPIGTYVMTTRWSSLADWSAAQVEMAERMSPGGALAELAGRYQPQQRVLMQELHEAGTTTGTPFVAASRFSVTGRPVGLDHAAKVAMDAGASGARVVSVLSGLDMTGHVIGITYLDGMDRFPDIVAAAWADEQFGADLQQYGAQLQSRTFFRML